MTFVDFLLDIFAFICLGICLFFLSCCIDLGGWLGTTIFYALLKRFPKLRSLFPARYRALENEDEAS